MDASMPSSYAENVVRAQYVYQELLDKIAQARRIYVGGTNAPGETEFLVRLYPSLVFVDDYKAGTSLLGKDVISTQELAKKADARDFLINNCLTSAGFNHFSRQAKSLAIPSASVVEVLAPHYLNGVIMNFPGLTSVYGPAFHRHTLENIEKYARLRSSFVDDLSQQTFDNLINYRLTGNPSLLHSVAVGHNYGAIQHDSYILNAQFFSLSDNEVFIDAGALDGYSSRYFIESVDGNFDRIVMFEPSSENAEKCRQTVAALDAEFSGKNISKKIDVVEAGLYDHQGMLSFSLSLFDEAATELHGVLPQAAHITDTGLTDAFVEKGSEYKTIQVPVVTLDGYIKDNPVTFIKFELEGSEVAALAGSTQTILKNKPKLALSIYHRPQDLELMIEYVQNLGLGYKMALRAHNPWCPDAIVLYCWI